MKYIILILFSCSVLMANDIFIKSLKVSKKDSPLSLPVLVNGEKLNIEFDIESSGYPDLVIVFRFCDQNWKPVENIFLHNNGYNIERNLWFEKMPTTVSGADYHYRDEFPNNDVSFPYSGKWKFYITDYQDTSIVYSSGKFVYINNPIEIYSTIKKERIEGITNEQSTFGQVYNLSTRFAMPDSMDEFRLMNVEIVENFKFDYPIIINKDYTSTTRYYEIDAGRRYKFTARDIQPGKEYRQADLRDKNKYSPPYTNAHFGDIDVSRLFDNRGRDNNGAFILNDFRSEYSDYMNVTFELRLPENVENDVYLVGSFTNWKVYPEFKMFIDEDDIYYLTVELKRGVYDYMYVTGKANGNKIKKINWLAIEGNDWYTNNDYHVFVYYRSEYKGEYDEIIGYQKISSGK